MATSQPTWSEVWAQIRAAVRLLRETFSFSSLATPNFVDLLDDVVSGAKGTWAPQMTRAANDMRSALSGLIGRSRDVFDPLILELGQVIGSSHRDVPSILRDVHDYMHANSESVVRRHFSRSSVTANGGNIGNGAIYAVTVDRFARNIETGGPYTTLFRCVADQNTGTPSGAAVFEIFTSGAPAPDLAVSGAGRGDRVTAKSRIAIDGLLANPSFRTYNSAATHPFAPWLVSGSSPSYAGISQIASGARPDRGTTTPSQPSGTRSCAKLEGTNLSLYQVVPSDLDPARPTAFVLWYRPEGACDGTLVVQVGSKTASVDLTGKSGWNRLAIASSADCWYANFKASPLKVAVWIHSRTQGYVLLDDALLVQMDRFNGRWFAIVAGTTDFEVGDEFSAVDTTANDLNIQGWIDRAYGTYLPHASGGDATIADPA